MSLNADEASKPDWSALFRLAVEILAREKINKNKWSFGGGTALMVYFNHRESDDVDIFLRDAQMLTMLTPRLNDFTAEKTNDYTEMSNFLKLKVGSQEIDFILSPFLTKNPVIEKTIAGIPAMIETPAEIIAKKILYRADSFKSRDVFDLAVSVERNEKEIVDALDVFRGRLEGLDARLQRIERIYDAEISRLKILDADTAKKAMSIARNFVRSHLNAPQPCRGGPSP